MSAVSHPDAEPPLFPRRPLIGLAALVGLSLAVAVAGRVVGTAPLPAPGSVVKERIFRFEDRSDGAVLVRDGRDGREVDVLTGEQGFIRGTLRSFARTRRGLGVGPAEPFRLAGWSSGRLTLDDLATGHRVDLDAFGTDNVAVFARLLTLPIPDTKESAP